MALCALSVVFLPIPFGTLGSNALRPTIFVAPVHFFSSASFFGSRRLWYVVLLLVGFQVDRQWLMLTLIIMMGDDLVGLVLLDDNVDVIWRAFDDGLVLSVILVAASCPARRWLSSSAILAGQCGDDLPRPCFCGVGLFHLA